MKKTKARHVALLTLVSPELSKLIRLLAASEGLTISKFIGRALEAETDRLCQDPRKALLKIST